MRLHDFVDHLGREHPDLPFALCCEERLSYGEAPARPNRIANPLAAAAPARHHRSHPHAKHSHQ